MRDERRHQILEAWKTIVEVQRHFNDISMRIRGMFVTILLALFASIGFLLDKKLLLEVWALKIQFATVVPLFGIFGTFLFYFIDRYWYHRLLVGSVKHGMSIEQKYGKELPELTLTAAIGAESPITPRGPVRWMANCVVSHDKYRQTGQLHSDGKIELFYKSVMLVLAVTTVLIALFGGVTIEKSTQANAVGSATPVTATPVLASPPNSSPPVTASPAAPVTPPAPTAKSVQK